MTTYRSFTGYSASTLGISGDPVVNETFDITGAASLQIIFRDDDADTNVGGDVTNEASSDGDQSVYITDNGGTVLEDGSAVYLEASFTYTIAGDPTVYTGYMFETDNVSGFDFVIFETGTPAGAATITSVNFNPSPNSVEYSVLQSGDETFDTTTSTGLNLNDDDLIVAGDGNDTINGGGGSDFLSGGDGDDAFLLTDFPEGAGPATGGVTGGTPTIVNQTTATNQSPPKMLALDDGRVLYVWNDDGASDFVNNDLQGRIYNADGTPSSDQFQIGTWRVSGDEAFDIQAIDLAQTSDGNVFIGFVRSRYDNVEAPAFSVIDPSFAPTDTANFVVASNQLFTGQIDNESPSILTALDDGRILAVWSRNAENDWGDMSVQGRIFNSDGTPSTNQFQIGTWDVDGGNYFDVNTIDVVQADNGNVFVGYVRDNENGGETPVFSVIDPSFNPGDAGFTPVTDQLFPDADAPGVESPPILTTLDDGRVLAVWNNTANADNGTDMTIQGRIFNNDGTASTDQFQIGNWAVDGYESRNIDAMEVSQTSDGNVVIGFVRNTSNGTDEPAFHIIDPSFAPTDPGFAVASDVEIQETDAGSYESAPVLASLADGRFVAVWKENELGDGNLTYRVFNSDGSPVTGDITVSNSTANQVDALTGFDVNSISVVATGPNTFVIGWVGANDGSGTGAFTSGPITLETDDGFGNDTIVGGEGAETTGDTIDASGMNNGIDVTFDGDESGTITQNGGPSGSTSNAIFSEIETIIVTDYDDIIDATATTQDLTFDGMAGDDFIQGGAGNDSILGSEGNDTLLGDGANDTIDGGADDDLIYGDNSGVAVPASPADTTSTNTARNFEVISLGNISVELDPTEGNQVAENRADAAFQGATFGSPTDPLSENVVTLSEVGSVATIYDGDNFNINDRFQINGGVHQTFDSAAIYDGTVITYEDGTTATVSAVVFQDTNGNTYLAPESSANTDTTLYTAQPITSITLGTADNIAANGLTATRVEDSWVEFSDTDSVAAGQNDGDDSIEGGAGNDTIYGEGGDDTIDGGADNDLIYGDDGETTINASEDFSTGPDGWVNASSGGYLSQNESLGGDPFFGRFGGGSSASEQIKKTFGLSQDAPYAVIEFDFLKIDSWDASANEEFAVFIDGVEIFNFFPKNTNGSGVEGPDASGSFAGGSWSVTSSGSDSNLGFGNNNSSWHDRVFNVRIVMDDPGDRVTLGMGAKLDSGISDESWGIDNVNIASTSNPDFDFSTTSSSLTDGNDVIDGGTGEDTIYGQGGDDLIDGGADNDTIYGDGTAALTPDSELLTNGGFDSNLDNWTIINPSGGQAPVHTTQAGGSIRLNSSDEAAGGDGLSQQFGTVIGKTYSAAIELEENGGNSASHTVLVEALDDNGTVIESYTTVIPNGGSETVYLDFVATSSTSEIRITNPSSTGTVGTDVLIVDASVTGVDPQDDPNDGNDTISGSAGDDFIIGGGGDDSIDGGADNDVIYGDSRLTASPSEQLNNGGFDSNLDRWTIINPTGGNAPAYSSSSGGSLRINSGQETAGGDGVSQQFGTAIGETYSASLDFEENGSGSASHTVLVEVLDENGTVIDSVTTVVGNGQSATATLDFVATTATSEIRITNPTSSSSNNSDLLITDVSVTGIDPSDTTSQGDDSIDGGEGNDLIYGEGGGDTLLGSGGNDTIYGDAGSYVRESFSYDTLSTTQVRDGVSVNTGNVDVTFSSPTETGITLSVVNGSPYTGGIQDDGNGPASNTVLQSTTGSSSSLGEYEWSFSEPVMAVNFNIVDLDANENIQIFAFDADNNPIEVILTPGSNVTVTDSNSDGFDDRADGGGSGGSGDVEQSITVTVPGPVSRIEAIHTLDSGGNIGIQFTEMFFDAPTPSIGDDLIDGGTGDDFIYGEEGTDTIRLSDSFGIDSIDGGEETPTDSSIDILDASAVTATGVNLTYGTLESGTVIAGAGNTATFENIEQVIVTEQDDTIDASALSDDVTLDGMGGDDTILGGSGDDSIDGGTGSDTLVGGDGQDTITGGAGEDTIAGGAGADTITGGTGGDFIDYSGSDAGVSIDFGIYGNGVGSGGHAEGDVFNEVDDIIGSGFDDTLSGYDATYDGRSISNIIDGGAGNDSIDGEGGNDSLIGGAGNDTLIGGAGVDTLTGGADADTFFADGTADLITDFDTTDGLGDNDPSNNDFIDLSAIYNETTLAAWNATPGNPQYNNPLAWLKADQADGTLDEAGGLQIQNGGSAVDGDDFFFENTAVVCFARGTRIMTPFGDIPIEELERGDMVKTLDNGIKPIRWIGHRKLSADDLAKAPAMRPILIKARSIGGGLPKTDLVVSPQHRVMIRSRIAKRMFGKEEVLIAAKHLLAIPGVSVIEECDGVEYWHFLFDQHEVVFAESMPAESLYTGKEALKTLSEKSRNEIFTLFPELANLDHDKLGVDCPSPMGARIFPKGPEARELTKRHIKNDQALLVSACFV